MRLNILRHILSNPILGCMGRPGCWALGAGCCPGSTDAGVGGICGLREEEQPGMCFPCTTPADLTLVCFSGGEKHIPSGGSDTARNGLKKMKGLVLLQCFEKWC